MEQKMIRLRGVRENNLKNISLDIPKGKLVVFTGVSGSGKSSVVFDTIAAEAQRQLNETYPMYVRSRMPHFEPPKADRIEGLPAAVVVSQKRVTGNARSTVGTMTDLAPLLRLLFSRCGTPSAGTSNLYSFNDPGGMCPECSGIGIRSSLDIDRMLDKEKSLNDGAILFRQFGQSNWQFKIYANSGLFDLDKPLKDYSEKEWDDLLYGEGFGVIVNEPDSIFANSPVQYEGLVKRFNRLYLNRSITDLSKGNQTAVLNVLRMEPCPVCGGRRLNPKALASKINGYNIADYGAMEVDRLIGVVEKIKDPVADSIVPAISSALRCISELGLGYLNLDRRSDSLSGGESQRLKMVRHLGSALSDMAYILDEPSIGLHPRDVSRLGDMLIRLRDKGNSVIVVEHDREIIERADEVIDLGPGSGTSGGSVLFQGPVEQLRKSDTITGRMLYAKTEIKTAVRTPSEWFEISHATENNLKDVSLRLPKGVLCAVTGVAGAGKSTLMRDVFMKQYPEAVYVSQSGIGSNIRSNTATYIGIMDEIRSLFAKKNKVSKALFSYNSKGACPVCKGKGEVFPDIVFSDPIAIRCEACEGKRYSHDVLQYKLRGKSITDLMDMTVDEALEFFEEPKILEKLELLKEVGLHYLTLGQATSTMSGGECQRLKLTEQINRRDGVFVLDEPTTGLHMSDTARLVAMLDRMVDRGQSIFIIEHNLDVAAGCDWIIDLGPDGGAKGGKVMFEGTPQEMTSHGSSYTAQFLRRAVR